ncbi:MAG: cupin domain-containing protein [Campylobacteraceae bacterium]|jgi:quercetin dioxygenase-like cupin family protein|nr:cupin domain-containing protein [Campylobacteraceae bacterium]
MNKTAFESETIYINGTKFNKTTNIEWQKHPKFDGVFTKSLFCSKDTNGNFSAMLVKIEPNCEIGNHIHEGKAELHEVIYGQGTALVNNKSIFYKSGVMSLIPADISHSVRADKSGLILLAKFTPPLN